MGKKAIKRQRAKFIKRVFAGKMTAAEAQTRLGRDVAQKSYGSA